MAQARQKRPTRKTYPKDKPGRKREEEREQAKRGYEIGYCAQPEVPERPLSEVVDPRRERFIRVNEKKWANGTVLKYYFFDGQSDGPWVGPERQRDVVRRAFRHWKELGIGLQFQEVADREDAEIRIGFMAGDGSWSYLGRDVVDVADDPNERTMNFGWDLTTPYGWDTALHEIGHTLGAPHEHQNPQAGIVWDEDAVYRYFAESNGWNRQRTHWNVLRKLSPAAITGSQWDPHSIMHYQFPPGLIVEPATYAAGLVPEPGLSEADIEWVRRFYPPLEDEGAEPELRPFESQQLTIGPGEQVNFRIRPGFTRTYTIQTFGRSDTVIVLFESIDGQPWYVAGDDDSGSDRNARLRLRLYRGREYVLRVRLYYSRSSGQTAVFMW